MSRDPMREYLEWERRERRRRYAWAAVGWLFVVSSIVIVGMIVWAALAVVFTL